jgi:hypothetical protein
VVGKRIEVAGGDRVDVYVNELDDRDAVVVARRSGDE